MKRAARGKTSDKKTLPFYLRKPMLINPAAVKRAYHVGLMKKWKKNWKDTDKGQCAARLDGLTPSRKFLTTISHKELSCANASRIAQFRLGHAPIN